MLVHYCLRHQGQYTAGPGHCGVCGASTVPRPEDREPEIPIHFSCPGRAYRWAEEHADLTDVPSSTLLVIRSMQQIAGRGASEWGRDDDRDLALTILSAVQQVDDRRALTAFLNTWRPHADAEVKVELTRHIAERLRVGHHNVSQLTAQRAENIAYLAIARLAARTAGRKVLAKARYATAIGVSRPAIYQTPWAGVIATAEALFSELLERAEVDITERLKALGVM